MPRKSRQLPAQNTLPYLLLTLTALCGEYPIRQISHLPGGSAYLESVVTALRRDGLLRTFSKDGLRGLRLTSSAKRLLLADAPEWFSAYLTGSSEPNKLKSEIPRRLRLHRMAEILTIMHNADIPAFPWEKAPFSAASQSAAIPAYYTSREVKEIGPQGAKIKSSRATGILLTDGGIFLTYNTAKAQMKWEYKAELRFKALLQTEGVMPDAEISGIVFGSTMEQLSILTQPDAHSYFLLDGSFPHFYYLTNDRYGEAILRLLCDTQQRRTLDAILADGLHEGIPNWRVENDAIDSEGNPVLFAYTCDFPRIRRFDTALELHGMTGTLICFDYEDVYGSRYNYGGKNVVDYQIPELEYGQLSTTQTGVMEKIMLPGLQGISASGSGIYGISPGGGTVEIPGFLQGGSTATPATPAFTELTQDFLLSNGAVGKISIPAIGVKNYYLWEGETTASMKKGLGHFTSTSVWNGNVAVCGHNRGAKYVIGSIKNLDVGDKITYTTSMGTRTYLVETVTKISSSDWSYLSSTADNRMTLLTCVAGDSSQRWCVQAVQAS